MKQGDSEWTKISHKIEHLSKEKKDFIAECFVVLAKLDYRIKFLEWRRD
jgi:hypothetical protein